MADGTPPPAVAVAEAVPQGSVAAGVVQGTAVGAPVAQAARTHARTVKAAGEAGPADSTVVAEAFVYTPFMARIFTGLDADHSGFLEIAEVEAALKKLGLKDLDATEAIQGFDKNGDGKVDLTEWEAGMKPEMRAAIEKIVDSSRD